MELYCLKDRELDESIPRRARVLPAGELSGKTISHYRVLEKLGSGGMGVVYRGKDLRLGRPVALKFIRPEELAANPMARGRIEREARAASTLNHPNICTIYDVAECLGQPVIVMELLEGEPLNQVISGGPLSTSRVIELGLQIADALDMAHAKGIIHRDIKPANIFITTSGPVKILDFGLAKLPSMRLGPADSPTVSYYDAELTQPGNTVGTLSYMSPEQLRGLDLDRRADLFSFGVVLYEMATGRRPFDGNTAPVIHAAILSQAPTAPVQLNPHVPPKLQEIIEKALEKDRDFRYQHATDIRADLLRIKRQRESAEFMVGQAVSPAGAGLRRKRLALAASLVLLIIAAALAFRSRKTEPPALHIRPLTNYPGGQYEPAFSPDGTQFAFVWNGEKQDNFDIYVQYVDGGAPVRLTTNPGGEGSPAWSPEGRRIAFLRYSTTSGESGFYIIPALGGPERKIADAAPLPHIFDRHLDWSPDGRYLAVVDKTGPASPFSIFLLSVETGERRRITTPSAQSIGDTGPAFSPDGRTLAFKRSTGAGVNDIYVVPIAGGEPRRLTFGNAFTASHVWSPDGRELIFSSTQAGTNGLWRVPASGGTPVQIPSAGQGAYYLAASRQGNYLAYSRWFADTNIWRLAIPSTGQESAKPEELISSTWEERSAQYSPDGTRIAFRSDRSGTNEIWVCDASGANPMQLTSFHGPLTGTPRWSPDGKDLVFDSRPGGNADIYTVPARGGAVRRITTNDSEDVVPSWSRDGKWIYFGSNRTGDWQVWKVKDGNPVQVTRQGGFAAFESTDGQTLYYAKGRDVAGLWMAPVSGGEERPVIPDFAAGFWGYWAVVARGVYYLDPLPTGRTALKFYSFERHASETIAGIPTEPPFGDSGFSVSPDGRGLLYTQVDHSGSDILLIENFR